MTQHTDGVQVNFFTTQTHDSKGDRDCKVEIPKNIFAGNKPNTINFSGSIWRTAEHNGDYAMSPGTIVTVDLHEGKELPVLDYVDNIM